MQTDKKPSVESEKRLKILKEHKSIVITVIEIQDDFCLILYKSDSQKGFWDLSTTVQKTRKQFD